LIQHVPANWSIGGAPHQQHLHQVYRQPGFFLPQILAGELSELTIKQIVLL
jgi:hypothetical protein